MFYPGADTGERVSADSLQKFEAPASNHIELSNVVASLKEWLTVEFALFVHQKADP